LPFRWSGFSPDFAVTTTGICNIDRSTGLHSPASVQPTRPPTGSRSLTVPRGLGGQLSPVHFRGPLPRWVSCYALFKGWLLLSLPSHCFWQRTPFSLTLSWHLGTLTSVRVVPLSAQRLTPWRPSLAFYGAGRFGV
jgi:hypothetical protein